jgi:hypothetical protein
VSNPTVTVSTYNFENTKVDMKILTHNNLHFIFITHAMNQEKADGRSYLHILQELLFLCDRKSDKTFKRPKAE